MHKLSNKPNRQVIVSMTSFPAAIKYATEAIRSILNGSVLPDKIVIYLTLSQFGEQGIPVELLRLAEEYPIFEIRDHNPDIGPYQKLVPAIKDFPEAVIVSVDDDICYHRHMLRDLLKVHHEVPDAIVAHRVRRINLSKPYWHWKKYHWYDFVFKRIHRCYDVLQTGVGGVLYPPHSLDEDMLDASLFTQIAPTTDDIWFWAAAVSKGTSIVPVPFGYNRPQELNKPDAISLKIKNYQGHTDRNLAAFTAILQHFPSLSTHLK